MNLALPHRDTRLPHLRLVPSTPAGIVAPERRAVVRGLAAHLQTLLAAGDYAAALPVAELLTRLLKDP